MLLSNIRLLAACAPTKNPSFDHSKCHPPTCRYILWEAEDEGLQLPYACRMGCCTACAVRVVEGEMYQPEALGISAELR